jgi:hypothetical protein
MITNLTLTQGILIYIVGFIFSLTIFKFVFPYKQSYSFARLGKDDHIFDITLFALTWMFTVPVLLIIGAFALIYKFCEWYLEF